MTTRRNEPTPLRDALLCRIEELATLEATLEDAKDTDCDVTMARVLESIAQAEWRVDAARAALAQSDEPREYRCRPEDGDDVVFTASSMDELYADLESDTRSWAESPDETVVWDWRIVGEDGTEETYTVELQPDGPECTKDEHDWQSPYELVGGCKENPGVWGSQHGGVVVREVCMHCGCERRTDTGATRSDNGTRMTSVSYEWDALRKDDDVE